LLSTIVQLLKTNETKICYFPGCQKMVIQTSEKIT
jgi:hypothetical protein